jgi:hypothetical protein
MSGNMPYVVEKGPYFAVLEAKLADQTRRIDSLRQLRTANPDLAALCAFESSTLNGPVNDPNLPGDGRSYDDRYCHFNWDWLGQTNGDCPPPANYSGYFWANWISGSPAAILREGMQRALEVSMGLEHGESLPPPSKAPKRFWPIDFYWICQGPFFQCWVVWRRVASAPSDLGHVSVLLTTPPAIGYPLSSQITRPAGNLNPKIDYASPPEHLLFGPQPPPKRTTLSEGMWVIGHDNYLPSIQQSTAPSASGLAPLPSLVWTAQDQTVVCVSPAEWEGGVLDAPRGYAP